MNKNAEARHKFDSLAINMERWWRRVADVLHFVFVQERGSFVYLHV